RNRLPSTPYRAHSNRLTSTLIPGRVATARVMVPPLVPALSTSPMATPGSRNRTILFRVLRAASHSLEPGIVFGPLPVHLNRWASLGTAGDPTLKNAFRPCQVVL